MALPQHQIEGKYEILQKLTEGGMGTIYKVRHRLLDEVRVIKVMRSQFAQNQELKERFLNEARTAIQLKHRNIAALYDLSVDEDDHAYIVMEFIDGRTLDEVLKAEELPTLRLTLEIARQTLEALAYLHSKSVVHRDMAPDNVMLTRDAEGKPLVKLIDLGIAKMLEADTRTATGVFLGKIRYSAPEHFEAGKGSSKVDHRCDLYSFSVVLYELLTGVFPIVGDSTPSLIAGHLFRSPRDFAETDPKGVVPAKLRRILLQALEKRAEDRPASAREFAAVVEEVLRQSDQDTDVTQDVETTLKLSTMVVEKTVRMARPGSTQDRLDVQFGMGPTQPPGEGPPPTSASPGPAPVEEVSEAVNRIRAQLDNGDLEGAERDLDEAEGRYGQHPSLNDLRLKVAEGRQREEEWATGVAQAVARIEELLDKELLEEADSELFRAERVFQDRDRFRPLRERLEGLLAQRRQNLAAELLAGAGKLCREGEFKEAIEELQKLLIVDSQNEQARQLLGEAKEAVELQKIQATIDAGELSAAEQALAEAQEGQDPQRIEELRRRLAQRRAGEQAEAHVATARTLLEEGQLREALAEIRLALELDPENDGTMELLAETEARLEKQAAEEGQALAVAEAVGEVEAYLAQRKLNLARERLDGAVQELGDQADFLPLRSRVDETLAELEARITEAQELIQAGKYQQACPVCERALEIDPESRAAQDLLTQARRAMERLAEEERLAQATTSAVRRIEDLLSEGQLAEASRELGTSVQELGELSDFKHLGARIETTVAEVKDLLIDAEKLVAAARYEPACRKLERVRSLDPDNARLPELLAEAEDGLELQQEEERRAQRRAQARRTIEASLAAGQLEEASLQLQSALERFGGVVEFKHVKARVETTTAEVQDLLSSARELLQKEKHAQAQAKLQRVLKLDVESSSAVQMLAAMGVAPVETAEVAKPPVAPPREAPQTPTRHDPLATVETPRPPPGQSASSPDAPTLDMEPAEVPAMAAEEGTAPAAVPQGEPASGEPQPPTHAPGLWARWPVWAGAGGLLLVGALTLWTLWPKNGGEEISQQGLTSGVDVTRPMEPGSDAAAAGSEGDADPPPQDDTLDEAGDVGSATAGDQAPTRPARDVETAPAPVEVSSPRETPSRPPRQVATTDTRPRVDRLDPIPREDPPPQTPPASPRQPQASGTVAGTATDTIAEATPEAEPGAEAAPQETPPPVEPETPPEPATPTVVVGQLINPCPSETFPTCVPPRAVTVPAPVYPRPAQRRRIEADIVIHVLVDENGQVEELRVAEGDRAGFGLKEAAIAAAREATYSPATVDAVRVKAWLKLPAMKFRVQ